MKLMRKLALVLALILSLAFCAAANADVILDPTANAATEAPTEEAAASTANRQIGIVPYDDKGNVVSNASPLSCIGGGTTLYVMHDYRLVVCYYDSTNGKITETSDPLLIDVDCDSEYLSYAGNTIMLKASPDAYNFTVHVADPSVEGGKASYNIGVTRFNFSIIELVIAGLGVYLMVNAIRGKGSTFGDQFIKDEKKSLFRRLGLITGIVAGLALIASAVLSVCFGYLEWSNTAHYICLGVAIVMLIGIAIVNSVFTDREKRDKADRDRLGGGSGSSAAAFEFDGTEPTLDEVLAEREKAEAGQDITE